MRVTFAGPMTVALIAYVGTASAQTSAQTAISYPHQLTAAELRANVPDSTAYTAGKFGAKTFAGYRSRDGKIHLKSPDFEDFGTYYITDDGLLCTKYNKARMGTENCQTVWQTGPGTGEAHLQNGQIIKGTTVPGNPEGL